MRLRIALIHGSNVVKGGPANQQEMGRMATTPQCVRGRRVIIERLVQETFGLKGSPSTN
jgi:hypothetical protein